MEKILSTAWIVPGKTERLRQWYQEMNGRKHDSLETLENEGVHREAAFILSTEHGDLLCVYIEVENMEAANEAFYSSPFEVDHQHAAVMDECTVQGAAGRIYADLLFELENPRGGLRRSETEEG